MSVPGSGRRLLIGAVVPLLSSIAYSLIVHMGPAGQWGVLGFIGGFGGPIYLLLSIWEAVRYDRGWRVIAAIVMSASAAILVWGTVAVVLSRHTIH